MIDLEVATRRAAIAAVVGEGALLAVPFEDFTAHGARDAVTHAFLLELREQRVEGVVENGLEVIAANAMAHEIPRSLELRAHLVAHRELEPMTRGRERLEPRGGHLRWRRRRR